MIPQSAAQLQRRAEILSVYNYTIEYKSTQLHENVYALYSIPLNPDMFVNMALLVAYLI